MSSSASSFHAGGDGSFRQGPAQSASSADLAAQDAGGGPDGLGEPSSSPAGAAAASVGGSSRFGSSALLSDRQYFSEKTVEREELRAALDAKGDRAKLEAMKRLVALMTMGRDVSQFFPDVVKNVITDSVEVKKLVYLYLVHYAETNADLALLSINTFQKDMASSNPRARANAMKAMSSISVPSVVPLIMIALRTTVKDSSPYVRKAAAASIPKVAAMGVDDEVREELVEMVGTLLLNTDTEVLGSALYAFGQVAPRRWDLIHPHFRTICSLLPDFEEWGQLVALGLLLQYGRTQFADPFAHEDDDPDAAAGSGGRGGGGGGGGRLGFGGLGGGAGGRSWPGDDIPMDTEAFYGGKKEEEADQDEEREEAANNESAAAAAAAAGAEKGGKPEYQMEDDHRMLLRSAATLLHSRNHGVVLAVVSLFYHLAPPSECRSVGKALMRSVRAHREIQFVTLTAVSSMARNRPNMFRPFLKDFFVYTSDPAFVRDLKLDIISCLVADNNVSPVLLELQAYTGARDEGLVTEAVKCIGRVAARMPDTGERCVRGLMRLVESTSPRVVAEAVVVMRRLLQDSPDGPPPAVVRSLAALLDTVQSARAREALVWIVGEYRDAVPLVAPDALRKLLKGFRGEEAPVRMQILNMAVKMYLSNSKQTALLFKYAMDLAKFDASYDLRDRARLLRGLFFRKKGSAAPEHAGLKDAMRGALLVPKPVPRVESAFVGRDEFTVGTLSHALGERADGYEALADFPEVPPGPDVRTPYVPAAAQQAPLSRREKRRIARKAAKAKTATGGDDFYGGSDSDSGSSSGSGSGTDSGSDSSSSSSSSSGSSSGSSSSSSSSGSGSDSDSDSGSSSGSGSSSDSGSAPEDMLMGSSSDEELELLDESVLPTGRSMKSATVATTLVFGADDAASLAAASRKAEREHAAGGGDNDDGLADALASFSVAEGAAPAGAGAGAAPSAAGGGGGAASAAAGDGGDRSQAVASAEVIPPRKGARGELLAPKSGGGLRVTYDFLRTASVYSARMSPVSLGLTNERADGGAISRVRVVPESVSGGGGGDAAVQPFDEIAELGPGAAVEVNVHVDFGGSLDAVRFDIETDRGTFAVQLAPGAGELYRPSLVSHDDFERERARAGGMGETSEAVAVDAGRRHEVAQRVANAASLAALPSFEEGGGGGGARLHRFAAKKMADDSDLFVEVAVPADPSAPVTVSVVCADMIFSGHVAQLLRAALE